MSSFFYLVKIHYCRLILTSLSFKALLYAIGLGKGAIPTAAAVNWVLKDGIGYLSKILLSKFGRHFDVNPKGWRLFADLLENLAYGLEIITPAFPQFFVLIGATAGAGRSAASLIQVLLHIQFCFFPNVLNCVSVDYSIGYASCYIQLNVVF